VESFSPKAIDVLHNEAVNWRLGTKGLRIPELAVEIYKRNMTFA
jgi:hypothetical protein